MNTRIWSKKIVAVLHHYRSNPHTTLFGITGDLDNLGVYVATYGRAKAEVLVDTYNRIIGSLFYRFIEQNPHLFHESNFLPAGEEIFIIGTCANREIAESMFQYFRKISIPMLLVEAGLGDEVMKTDISFGCHILNTAIDVALIDDMLMKIDCDDLISANRSYVAVVESIRNVLAHALDLEKFGDITQEKEITILLRNIIYVKTLQYKYSTRDLLLKLTPKIAANQELRSKYLMILGNQYGLEGREYRQIVTELEQI